MRTISFKTKNRDIQAFQHSNSFGDQDITVLDISKNDSSLQYYGEMLIVNTELEGNWCEFTEKNIKQMLKDMWIEL